MDYLQGSCPGDSPGKNAGVVAISFSGILLTQGSNPVSCTSRQTLTAEAQGGSPSAHFIYKLKSGATGIPSFHSFSLLSNVLSPCPTWLIFPLFLPFILETCIE